MDQPNTMPGFCLFIATSFIPTIETKPNTTKMMIFSKVLAAIILCGIPFFAPYPSLMYYNISGTTTAGATAVMQIEYANDIATGYLNPNFISKKSKIVSVTNGINVSNITPITRPLNESSREPLTKIIIKEKDLM